MNFQELENGPIKFDDDFVRDLGCMILTRERTLDTSFIRLASIISQLENLRQQDNRAKWAYHVALLVKFLYPMMEQLDALVDDKIKITQPHNHSET